MASGLLFGFIDVGSLISWYVDDKEEVSVEIGFKQCRRKERERESSQGMSIMALIPNPS